MACEISMLEDHHHIMVEVMEVSTTRHGGFEKRIVFELVDDDGFAEIRLVLTRAEAMELSRKLEATILQYEGKLP